MTTPLSITADLEMHPWSDVDPDTVIPAELERIGFLRHGTTGGRGAVALLVRLPDGRVVIAQTTWRLFNNAAHMLAVSPAVAEEDPGP